MSLQSTPAVSLAADIDDTPAIRLVKAFALEQYQDAQGSHDWEHTLRVVRLCRHIGPPEGADMTVLLAAAYLHDIGRGHQDDARGAVCHAEKGAELAAPFVAELPLSEAQKENILHCMATHRFRGKDAPKTLEARVLFDADKLDAIGAVGIARAYLFAGEVGAKLHTDIPMEEPASYSEDDTGYREFKVKLCKIKDRILTETGRQDRGRSAPVHGTVFYKIHSGIQRREIINEHQCSGTNRRHGKNFPRACQRFGQTEAGHLFPVSRPPTPISSSSPPAEPTPI